MTEQKFCKDCKHSSKNLVWCNSPNHGTTINLVTGQEFKKGLITAVSREYADCCGFEGKWWEPKPPTYWQKLKTYFQ